MKYSDITTRVSKIGSEREKKRGLQFIPENERALMSVLFIFRNNDVLALDEKSFHAGRRFCTFIVHCGEQQGRKSAPRDCVLDNDQQAESSVRNIQCIYRYMSIQELF